VYSDEELKMIGTIASENDLFIIGDEVYREFVYDGTPYTSLGKFEELSDRVVLIDSVSKRYSACGARIGCMISKNPDFIATAIKFCQGRGCPPTMDQVGAANLYTTPTSYLEEVNKEYSRRRDVLYSLLEKIPGVVCQKPKGAFYIIAKMPVPDSEKFVLWLLNEFDLDGETLMMAPAEGFYSTHGLGKTGSCKSYADFEGCSGKISRKNELIITDLPMRK
jgi:aspartate aminotransferase